jgi:hypothetical protein
VAKALLELKAALTSQQSQWDRDEIVYKAKLDDSKKAIDDLEAKVSPIVGGSMDATVPSINLDLNWF